MASNDQEQVIRHVLWHHGSRGGSQPGNFTARIMEAFQCADPANRARLAVAFPEYAAAMWLAQEPRGVAALQAQLKDTTRPTLAIVPDVPAKE